MKIILSTKYSRFQVSLYTIFVCLSYCTKIYSQNYELIRTPNGVDTLFVDKSKILIHIDTSFSFDYIKVLLDNTQYFDSLHIEDALEGDTMSYAYKIRLKPGITDSKYLNSIIFLKDTLHFVLNNCRFFNDGRVSETGILIISLTNLIDTSGLISECNMFGHKYLGLRKVGQLNLGLVKTNETGQTFDFAEYLHSTSDYLFAESNLAFWNSQTFTPNDWHYGKSWHLKNIGSNNPQNYSGTVGADINAEEAWDNIYQGSCTSIKVAIIDDGVWSNHPDLLTFGYGFNALKHDPFYSVPTPGYNRPTYWNNNGMPEKTSAHGTPCAGIACGKGNNGIGITGVAYNSLVFGIKSIHQGFGTTLSFAYGYYLSIDSADADIISGSFGIFATRIGRYNSFLINSAIDYAVQFGRDGLGTPVFHSTGNGDFNGCLPGIEIIGYPANYPPTIAVTGTDVCDNLKGDGDCTNQCSAPANFGIGTDLAAPYNDIWSTDNSGSRGYEDSNYTIVSGTSASCPIAAGTMALIYSANPFLTLNQSRFIIESSTDKIGAYTYNSNVNGQPNGTWSEELGYGRINAGSSVIKAINTKIKLKAMNVPNEFLLDQNIIFKNNFITYPIIDIRFNDNNGAYGNYNVTWYKNGKVFYTSTTNQVNINSPGRYHAIIENNCNNKTFLLTETIDIRADCSGGLGYNFSYVAGATISVPITMPTVSPYEYVLVEGDIVVTTGGSLTVSNRVFILGSCAKIVVQSGGTFTASNCKFIGCDNWQGIICTGGASNISIVNCQIQDATAGIISKDGGNIAVSFTEFAYNYLHVGAEDGLVSTTFLLNTNNFLCLKDLGIVADVECSNSYYSGLSISTYQPQIFIDNMQSGDFENNTLVIDNNDYFYENINSIIMNNSENIDFVNNSFTGDYKIVFYGSNSSDIELTSNYFENSNHLTSTNIDQDAIFLDQIEDFYISENEVKYYRYGIQFIQNIIGAILTKIELNKFRNNYVGIVYANSENPIGAGLGSSNIANYLNRIEVDIECNLFTGNSYGVVGSGTLKNQGIGSNSAGNRFTLNGNAINTESSFIGTNGGTPIFYKFSGWGNLYDDEPVVNNNAALNDVDGVILHYSSTNNNIVYSSTGTGLACTNIISFTVSLDEFTNSKSSFFIFPNPANDILNIEGLNGLGNFKIYSIDGKIMQDEKIDSKTIKIDISELKNGIYFIAIEIEGKLYNFKFIKISES